MAEGIQLAVVGISVVFLFLAVMVGIMYGLAWVSKGLEGRLAQATPPGSDSDRRDASVAGGSRDQVAAIAAVHHHRRRRREDDAGPRAS